MKYPPHGSQMWFMPEKASGSTTGIISYMTDATWRNTQKKNGATCCKKVSLNLNSVVHHEVISWLRPSMTSPHSAHSMFTPHYYLLSRTETTYYKKAADFVNRGKYAEEYTWASYMCMQLSIYCYPFGHEPGKRHDKRAFSERLSCEIRMQWIIPVTRYDTRHQCSITYYTPVRTQLSPWRDLWVHYLIIHSISDHPHSGHETRSSHSGISVKCYEIAGSQTTLSIGEILCYELYKIGQRCWI